MNSNNDRISSTWWDEITIYLLEISTKKHMSHGKKKTQILSIESWLLHSGIQMTNIHSLRNNPYTTGQDVTPYITLNQAGAHDLQVTWRSPFFPLAKPWPLSIFYLSLQVHADPHVPRSVPSPRPVWNQRFMRVLGGFFWSSRICTPNNEVMLVLKSFLDKCTQDLFGVENTWVSQVTFFEVTLLPIIMVQ